MTDLDEFKAFFRKKGVPHEVQPEYEGFIDLHVEGTSFRFDHKRKFCEIHSWTEDDPIPRLPAPEGG